MTPTERADTFLQALDAYLVAWQEALAGYGPQPEVREEMRRAVAGLVSEVPPPTGEPSYEEQYRAEVEQGRPGRR